MEDKYVYMYILYTYTFYKQIRLVRGPTMTKVKKYLVSQAYLRFSKII